MLLIRLTLLFNDINNYITIYCCLVIKYLAILLMGNQTFFTRDLDDLGDLHYVFDFGCFPYVEKINLEFSIIYYYSRQLARNIQY